MDDDVAQLTALNEQFIEAFRKGSWDTLRPILTPSFSFLDGASGDVWGQEQYIAHLDGKPVPDIAFDQVAIHVDGDAAVVSARTTRGSSGRYNRYVDTYERRPEGWRCMHACVWPLQ